LKQNESGLEISVSQLVVRLGCTKIKRNYMFNGRESKFGISVADT